MSSFGIPNVAPELEATLIRQMTEVESLLLSHTRSEYPFVDETAHNLVAAGGKRLRPLLTLLTAQFGDSTREGVVAAAVACEITHLATLYTMMLWMMHHCVAGWKVQTCDGETLLQS